MLFSAGSIWWLSRKSHHPVTWEEVAPGAAAVRGTPKPCPHSHRFLETQSFPICLQTPAPLVLAHILVGLLDSTEEQRVSHVGVLGSESAGFTRAGEGGSLSQL